VEVEQDASEGGIERNGATSGNIYCFASSSIRRCSFGNSVGKGSLVGHVQVVRSERTQILILILDIDTIIVFCFLEQPHYIQ